ncbi:MAG: glutamate--tRNA ligase [Solirubrobacterales bacterium]|nr:glutamate--tRNA ligase [Solirubrobacterales bacterium]
MTDPSKMRLRFAPSPTGSLHIGGARTALFNWLLARGAGATLVLRIEDTDRDRSTPENVDQILDALKWLELDWDEGPIFQSDNAVRHQEVLVSLLDAGLAYRSLATADDVRAYKDQHGSERGFRGQDDGEGAVRLRVPEGASIVDDAIRGETRFEHVHLDDPVIARADGSVLYNFAVAVDDHDAGITHVVRGDDHLSNTPKQLLVFAAMGATAPIYAHLPLLHGPDGKKLSKRHGAASVQELRDDGYLPEAIRNYIALLGWGTDDDETLLSTDELKRRFGLDHVSKSPAIFDEKKLRWMNGRYLRELTLEDLTARLELFTGRTGLAGAVEISREKIQTLADFWPLVGFVFDGPAEDQAAWDKTIGAPGAVEILAEVRSALAAVAEFDVDTVQSALRAIVEERGVKPNAVFQPLRVAMAGTTISPGIFETAVLLGREETLSRVDRALERGASELS